MATGNSFASLAASLSNPLNPSYVRVPEPFLDRATLEKRQYIRTLHHVIEQSDVVILVLDARDPDGCRSKVVEEEVRRRDSEGKKLVFLLNKTDLVPQDNAIAWLRYLRHTAPAIPFRSSTQQQSTNLRSRSAPALMNLIKSYKNGPASRITVGVVGYPNVGKSSVINSLKRSKVCAVAAEAGWTRDLQNVQIDRGIRIIDSPGVVFDDDEPSSAQARSGMLLRNVLRVENVEDPLAVVEEIVARTEKETLQRIYKLPNWNTMLEFLTMLALSTGRLLKGGTPDLLSAARTILKDWNANKIPYFSDPPLVHPSSLPSNAPGAENVGEATIVQGGLGEAFSLEGLYGQAMLQDQDSQDGHDGGMDEDGHEMEAEDMRLVIPQKRSLSLTPDLVPTPAATIFPAPGERAKGPPDTETRPQTFRGPVAKRSKFTYDTILDSHVKGTMDVANPLGRRAVKQKAKKERKAAARAFRAHGGGMEVDNVGEMVEVTSEHKNIF